MNNMAYTNGFDGVVNSQMISVIHFKGRIRKNNFLENKLLYSVLDLLITSSYIHIAVQPILLIKNNLCYSWEDNGEIF